MGAHCTIQEKSEFEFIFSSKDIKKKTLHNLEDDVLHLDFVHIHSTSYDKLSSSFDLIILLFFPLSSIFYVRRKYWKRENFRLPVFTGFTRFGMS